MTEPFELNEAQKQVMKELTHYILTGITVKGYFRKSSWPAHSSVPINVVVPTRLVSVKQRAIGAKSTITITGGALNTKDNKVSTARSMDLVRWDLLDVWEKGY